MEGGGGYWWYYTVIHVHILQYILHCYNNRYHYLPNAIITVVLVSPPNITNSTQRGDSAYTDNE